MLTPADIDAWIEIQDGLARAAERDWQARVMEEWTAERLHTVLGSTMDRVDWPPMEFYERRKAELMRPAR